MAATVGCSGQLVGAAVSAPAAVATTSRTTSTMKEASAAPCGVLQRWTTPGDRRNVMTLVALSSRSVLSGAQLTISSKRGGQGRRGGVVEVRGYQSSSDVVGEDPDWSEDDFLPVGLAHCFRKDEEQKLMDAFVIEPIPAGQLECMDNGGVTCYKHATGTTLGVVLQQDASLLPKEFAGAAFCESLEFRAKCASRTWRRDHPRQNLMHLVPRDGTVRSDWNFSMKDKRVLNQEHVVKDSDNIKQDMSIDVYGRTEKEEEMTSEVAQLYNV